MSHKSFGLLIASAALGLGAMASGPASATALILTSTPGGLSYSVSEQTPCIIGDHASDNTKGGCSPKKNNITGDYLPATAVYAAGGGAFQTFENDFGSGSTPQYTVGQFANFPVFSVAIDENSMVQSAGQIDNLIWFRVYIGGSLAFEYFPSTPRE